MDAIGRGRALESGIRLEAITVVWMLAEAVLAIGAGVAARSVLLTAFGTDSVIELLSGVTLLWRLRAEARNHQSGVEALERSATRVSAALLILLCLYVGATSLPGLILQWKPDASWLGIVVAAAAVVAMPWLANRKRKVNDVLHSPALRADIAESATCAYLAAVTLVGLGIDAVAGWWWIQYVAALVLLRWLIPEAREALEAARDVGSD